MRKLRHWTEEYTVGESEDLLNDLAVRVALKSSKTRHLAQFARKRDYVALCSAPVPYEELDPPDASLWRQAQACFQKWEPLDVGIDIDAVTQQKWLDAESLCRETNDLFRKVNAGKVSLRREISAIFYQASQIIARMLGDVPEIEDIKVRFGPGATTSTEKSRASIVAKLSDKLSCSEELIPIVGRLLAELPHMVDSHWTTRTIEVDDLGSVKDRVWSVPVEIHGEILSLVPKNYLGGRFVSKQPTLNSMLQLGIGDLMTKRLKRKGLDLTDQYPNRDAAFWGSITGALATLDLSSASDTIATELVAHLLPIDWYLFLCLSRCGKVKVPWSKDLIVLEKFAAMGNGFTFPLESVIFYSLALATAASLGADQDEVRTYGDDIVLPVECVDLFSEVLVVAGFVLNRAKSFSTGPFRESCGADFLGGKDIRPVYVKEVLSPARLCVIHNGLFRRGWYDLAAYVRSLVHTDCLLYGPDGYGDGHFLSESWVGWTSMEHINSGYEGLFFDTYQLIPKRDSDCSLRVGYDTLPLYTIYRRACEGLIGTISEPTAPLPLEVVGVRGSKDVVTRKRTTVPGVEGYKKISIYMLGTLNIPREVKGDSAKA